MPRPAASPPHHERDLLTALRAATRGGHRRVELQPLSLQMLEPPAAASAYPRWLAALAPELCQLEQRARSALAATDWAPLLPAWSLAGHLADDLQALGRRSPAVAKRGRSTIGSGVAALYVLVGSQLGARVLLRNLALDAPAARLPCSYLRAAADDGGWPRLRQRLGGCIAPPWAEMACRSARRSFARLDLALAEAAGSGRSAVQRLNPAARDATA